MDRMDPITAHILPTTGTNVNAPNAFTLVAKEDALSSRPLGPTWFGVLLEPQRLEAMILTMARFSWENPYQSSWRKDNEGRFDRGGQGCVRVFHVSEDAIG
jgi:hypothetical protein